MPEINDILLVDLSHKVSAVFSPAAPINRRDLFAGRIVQLQRTFDAVSTGGQHAVIFGERGVGKTSLANIVQEILEINQNAYVVKVNCSQDDHFAGIWRKALDEIIIEEETGRYTMGLKAQPISEQFTAAQMLPEEPSPNDIRRIVDHLGSTVMIFDEFDRIPDRQSQGLFADTIKTLSDASTDCTLVVVGVAHDIDGLIKEHASIDRSLVQILMPRMTSAELHEILNKAMATIGTNMTDEARNLIVLLSQGLPHYTHVLGKASTMQAINARRWDIALDDVKASISSAIENTQQSIQNAYQKATSSPRKDTLFKHVLLACALAEVDDLGFFASADVREPLTQIMGKPYDIPNFSQHLNKFSSPDRGNVLEKSGTQRRFRFRFSNPLLQPFVIMRGISDKMLEGDMMKLLKRKVSHE